MKDSSNKQPDGSQVRNVVGPGRFADLLAATAHAITALILLRAR
jgi:hypothetical protein